MRESEGFPNSSRWFMVDVAIAMQNMVLAATAEGLGTCWVGSFNEEEVKEMLRIPDDHQAVALLALGYPYKGTDIQGRIPHLIRRRKNLEEIVSFEEFGKKNLTFNNAQLPFKLQMVEWDSPLLKHLCFRPSLKKYLIISRLSLGLI
ncbi:MAG: nitroreductase family protein [Candidatus Bathyarchaeia archaeon]